MFIILVLSSVLFFSSTTRKGTAENWPVLGKESLAEVAIVEDHRVALEHWAERGIRNAVLVNMDAHDDMRRVPPEEMAHLRAVYEGRERQYCSTDGRVPVTNGNFIHAAAKLGIVSKVIWVVPPAYDLFSDQGERFATLLKMYGFPNEDIRSFTRKGRRFVGEADGIPLVVCDSEDLPEVREPLLLSVDVDYFPAASGEDLQIADAVKQAVGALFARGYAVRDTVVAYSVNGGFLDVSRRWVGDLVVDSLRIPGLIFQSELPGRYALLQRADLLLRAGRYGELLDVLSPFVTEENAEPSLLVYAAFAHEGRGEMERSFRAAERACRTDASYCYGLPQLGTLVLDEKGLAEAQRFFVRGYELSPGMDAGQFRLAMALKEAGRLDDAITYFRIFRDCYGPFPVDFYLAETYLLKGDEASALGCYDRGRKELARNPQAIVGFGDVQTIESAAVFYERKGLVAHAASLRKNAQGRAN
ncbi:MAG TPA: hypothetical protein VI389_01685 [Geobacteraceae bacterium]